MTDKPQTTKCPECHDDRFERGVWREGNYEHICKGCGQSWFPDVQYSDMTLPDLPVDLMYVSVRFSSVSHNWAAVIKKKDGNCHVMGIEGWGPTPRKAVLSAMEKTSKKMIVNYLHSQ